VGLDKLILPDVREGLEGANLAEAWLAAALGPVAGIGITAAKGLHSIAKGDVQRGLEELMPAAIKGPLKALRYAREGAIDKTGIPIVEDTNVFEEAGQALGFSPSRVREATEGKSAIVGAERALQARRSALMEQYAHAKMAGDAEKAEDVMAQIKAFNVKHPERGITGPQIAASVIGRKRRIAESENGVYVPRKHRDIIDVGRFADREDD
jgi:hypothetical protein